MKEAFVDKYGPMAEAAGKKYNINPIVILAQGAHEGAFGTSALVVKTNNHFGITAAGNTNEYWKGKFVTVPSGLKFRLYDTPQDSFYDFARLIRNGYPTAASLSFNPPAYAKAISQSPYISEQNGDNREAYRKAIENYVVWITDYLKKKGVSLWSGNGGASAGSNNGTTQPLPQPKPEPQKPHPNQLDEIMITHNAQIIGENDTIEIERGCFKMLMRNIGSDKATVLLSIPLNPSDPDIILGSEDPMGQINEKVVVSFAGVSSVKKVLVIKYIRS